MKGETTPLQMMIRKIISEIAIMLLVLLFVYASASKLIDFNDFQTQMLRQPLPEWMTILLAWTLLPVELIAAASLAYLPARKAGLYLSFGLMILFTAYTALAVTKVFDNIPCVCGGVLKSMDWGSHLIFNVAFMLVAFLGIITSDNSAKPSEQKKN